MSDGENDAEKKADETRDLSELVFSFSCTREPTTPKPQQQQDSSLMYPTGRFSLVPVVARHRWGERHESLAHGWIGVSVLSFLSSVSTEKTKKPKIKHEPTFQSDL